MVSGHYVSQIWALADLTSTVIKLKQVEHVRNTTALHHHTEGHRH